jgi:hypothetical protein
MGARAQKLRDRLSILLGTRFENIAIYKPNMVVKLVAHIKVYVMLYFIRNH